jgi:hypothetical protein
MRETLNVNMSEPESNYGAISSRPLVGENEARPSQPLRSINIEPLNRGFVVRVGCQTFAIGTKRLLIDKLTQYLSDPQGTEDKWNKGELF